MKATVLRWDQLLFWVPKRARESKTLDGLITSWNGGAKRLFGFTTAEMIGKPAMSFSDNSLEGQPHRHGRSPGNH